MLRKFANFKVLTHRTNNRWFCSDKKTKLSNFTRGPVTYISLGLMVLTGFGVAYYFNEQKEVKIRSISSEQTSVGKPSLGGPWILVDQDGKIVSDESFHGQFCLLYFGFTYCPDICPSELVKIGKVIAELEKRGLPKIQPIFISVDPNRDTVSQLKHYSQDFHRDIIYLTGTREQIARATKAYRVYFSKANENLTDEDDYLVDHSIVLYLIAPDGSFLDFFTQRMQVGDIVERIKKQMNLLSKAA
eukprot:gene6113-8428_t